AGHRGPPVIRMGAAPVAPAPVTSRPFERPRQRLGFFSGSRRIIDTRADVAHAHAGSGQRWRGARGQTLVRDRGDRFVALAVVSRLVEGDKGDPDKTDAATKLTRFYADCGHQTQALVGGDARLYRPV